MATQLTKTVEEATDQVVDIIEQAQDATASVVRSVSEAVAQYVPELALGEVLLSPEEAVESSFRVGTKFVDAGRKATLGMLSAVAPVTEKIFGTKTSAPKAVAKSA
jgi:hypothetical protein